jgi:hypothetical protein
MLKQKTYMNTRVVFSKSNEHKAKLLAKRLAKLGIKHELKKDGELRALFPDNKVLIKLSNEKGCQDLVYWLQTEHPNSKQQILAPEDAKIFTDYSFKLVREGFMVGVYNARFIRDLKTPYTITNTTKIIWVRTRIQLMGSGSDATIKLEHYRRDLEKGIDLGLDGFSTTLVYSGSLPRGPEKASSFLGDLLHYGEHDSLSM